MRFYKYLKENKMTIPEALAVFGLRYEAIGNKALIKKRFRDLAKTYHPDKIGNNDIMVKVNLAYELLKKAKQTSKDKLSSQAKSNLMKDLGSMFGGRKRPDWSNLDPKKGVYA